MATPTGIWYSLWNVTRLLRHTFWHTWELCKQYQFCSQSIVDIERILQRYPRLYQSFQSLMDLAWFSRVDMNRGLYRNLYEKRLIGSLTLGELRDHAIMQEAYTGTNDYLRCSFPSHTTIFASLILQSKLSERRESESPLICGHFSYISRSSPGLACSHGRSLNRV